MSHYSDLLISQSVTYYWNLDDTSGGATATIGGLNLAATGSPIYSVLGAVNTAVTFALGGDGFASASTADMNFTAGQSFSFSFMFNIPSYSVPQGLISKSVSSVTTRHFAAFINTANHLFFDVGNNQERWDTNWTPALNRWYHVAFTYNGATNEYQFYANGSLIASSLSYLPTTQSTNAPFYIGLLGGSSTSVSRGPIDEVAVFMGKVLSANEITAQYRTVFPITRVFDGASWKHAERTVS